MVECLILKKILLKLVLRVIFQYFLSLIVLNKIKTCRLNFDKGFIFVVSNFRLCFLRKNLLISFNFIWPYLNWDPEGEGWYSTLRLEGISLRYISWEWKIRWIWNFACRVSIRKFTITSFSIVHTLQVFIGLLLDPNSTA